MAERFELSELDDVATFLELVEDAGTTAFITIGGRDRFAVVPVEKYAATQSSALKAERELDEVKEQLARAEQRAAEAERKAEAAEMTAAAANIAQGNVTPSSLGATSSITITTEESDGETTVETVTEYASPSAVSDASASSAPASTGSAPKAPAVEGSEPYQVATLPNTPIDSDDYQRSMWHDAILDRMRKVMAAEAPIERQRLFNTVRASFGIKRSGRDIQSHNEWLFNRAIDCKTTEFNDATFVWLPEQDPATYAIFRVSSEDSGRQITEIPYEELRNAMAAALAAGKALSRDELIEATMRLLGYKRKTTRVRDVIGAAIERAADEGTLKLFSDGTFRLG